MDRLVTLFTGSKQATVRDAAITFFYEGLSVIPLMGKKATIDWAKHQHEIAIPEKIHQWSHSGRLKNVGIVCGEVSRNLVVMDLDGQAAVEAYEIMFPELLNTFTVITGSGKGKHLYYRVNDLPQTTRLNYPNHQAIELRANGLYVVAPPSIHPDTYKPYLVPAPKPIMKLPDLNPVRAWLYQQWLQRQKPKPPRTQRTIVGGSTPRWAEAALTYESRDVRNAAEGVRNDRLNLAAYNLGQIVGDGHLQASRVEYVLLIAAKAAGLGEREALATIASGLKAGQSSPRSQQWQKSANR